LARYSRIPKLLIAQAAAVLLMMSCASGHAPHQLTVQVARDFVGTLTIATCVPSASDSYISANREGRGETSVCPANDESISVVVVRGDRRVAGAPESVSILRAGDGVPTSIRATVRP
jgi:hypothetical protein